MLSREPDFWIARWMLGLAFDQKGDYASGVAAHRHAPVSFLHLAAAHAALGRHDEAFRCLREVPDQHGSWMAFANVDPRLDPLQTDPRHEALAGSLNL